MVGGGGQQPLAFGDDTALGGDDVFGGQDFGGGDDDGGGGQEDFFSAEQWEDANAVAGGSGSVPAPQEDGGRRGAGPEMVVTHDNTGEGMFDFFDGRALKNWAGPEHWKMRRAPPARTEGGDITRTRKERTAFAINFAEAPVVGQKELFASATAASLRAPRAKAAAAPAKGGRMRTRPPASREEEFVLPDDIHFSSQVLLRLFLKPKTLVRLSSPLRHLTSR